MNDIPLPETQRELELLLEALHALNNTLDDYETEMLTTATTAGRENPQRDSAAGESLV